MAKISKDYITHFFEHEFNYETRTLCIGAPSSFASEGQAEIDARVASNIIKGLHILEHVNTNPIKIYLNSVGGEVYHALAIYDAIRSCTSHVTIRGMGQVMSAGAIILQASESRLLSPNATVMLHDGQDGYEGHPRDFERWAEWSKHMRSRIYEIFAERSGKEPSYWRRKMDHDMILTSDQAVAEGLADSVVPHVKKFDKE